MNLPSLACLPPPPTHTTHTRTHTYCAAATTAEHRLRTPLLHAYAHTTRCCTLHTHLCGTKADTTAPAGTASARIPPPGTVRDSPHHCGTTPHTAYTPTTPPTTFPTQLPRYLLPAPHTHLSLSYLTRLPQRPTTPPPRTAPSRCASCVGVARRSYTHLPILGEHLGLNLRRAHLLLSRICLFDTNTTIPPLRCHRTTPTCLLLPPTANSTT